ncbi:MAG TPA: amidohydrolase family protein [Spirochaetia bacterium]|nr:amidohydrolase family protein [Spirochaetia bacterium]
MIDCNCFFGPRSMGRELLNRKDFDTLRASGIREVCVSTTKLGYYDLMEGNREILELCRGTDFLHPVLTMQLGMGDIGREGELLALDAKLYRLYFDTGLPPRFQDPTLSRFLEGVHKKRGSLIVPYGSDTHGLIEQTASRFSDMPVIVTGINYPQIRPALALFASCSNTYMEISHFSAFNGLEYLARVMGAGRLVFGTNSPVYAHRSNVLKLRMADLSEEEKERIGERNFLEAVGGLK